MPTRGSASRLEFGLFAALTAAGLGVGLAPAAADPIDIQHAQSALDAGIAHQAEADRKVRELSHRIDALRSKSIAAAKAIQAQEDALTKTENELAILHHKADLKHALLDRQRHEMVVLLAAMERMARRPPESLIAYPAPPQDVLRGAAVLRAVLPPLQAKVEALASDVDDLDVLTDEIARKQERATAKELALEEQRADLDAMLSKALELHKHAQSDSQAAAERVKMLAAKAADLNDLVGRLNADAAAQKPQLTPPRASDRGQAQPRDTQIALAPTPWDRALQLTPPKPFSAEKGLLKLPVSGKIVQKFGAHGNGIKNRGIIIATRPGAPVIAPYDGQVAFAGPFRGYGQLLIISQGEGYHILLAGLSRIDCVVGQRLLAGEPVGVMGPTETGDPQLYFELRHDGEPINPLPWVAARNEKVSG